MKIFISHSTKNAWMLDELMSLIYAVKPRPDTVIFCSSDENAIDVAENWREAIYKNLKDADVFVAVISKEYWESKYCAFELGAAYERYCNENEGSIQILPMLVFPDPGELRAVNFNSNYLSLRAQHTTRWGEVSLCSL